MECVLLVGAGMPLALAPDKILRTRCRIRHVQTVHLEKLALVDENRKWEIATSLQNLV